MEERNEVKKTQQEKVKEITDKLHEGIKNLFNSDTYRNYLKTVIRQIKCGLIPQIKNDFLRYAEVL